MGLEINENAIFLWSSESEEAQPLMSIALSLLKAYHEIRFLRSCLSYGGLTLLLCRHLADAYFRLPGSVMGLT